MAMAMKITKTEMTMNIGNGVSHKVYVCKNRDDANALHQMAMTMKPQETRTNWYYHVSTFKVGQCCIVPEFFHDQDYTITVVEHNNGDWDEEPKYELYLVG
jgi:hypothetical protein